MLMNMWFRVFGVTIILFSRVSLAQQSVSEGIDEFNKSNYPDAYRILSQNEYSNDSRALYYLGVMLDQGLGTTINSDAATKALLKSSNMGNFASRIYLAESEASVIGPEKLEQLVYEKSAIKQRMKDNGMKFFSFVDEPEFPSDLDKKNLELYETYHKLESQINDFSENEASQATYIGNDLWQVGDVNFYLTITKKENPEFSLFNSIQPKYIVSGEWDYSAISSMKKQGVTLSLSFKSKRNYENKCLFFKDISSNYAIDYEKLFKECYVNIFVKKENSDSKFIGSIKFLNYETAGKAYQDTVKSIAESGSMEANIARFFIGLVALFVCFFILKVVISIIKKAKEKIRENIANVQDGMIESRLKRKMEDSIIEETAKHAIKEKSRVEEEIDKAIIRAVVNKKVENNSDIDLTQLKQDITIALKNGEYDKVKELTELAEKLHNLNN